MCLVRAPQVHIPPKFIWNLMRSLWRSGDSPLWKQIECSGTHRGSCASGSSRLQLRMHKHNANVAKSFRINTQHNSKHYFIAIIVGRRRMNNIVLASNVWTVNVEPVRQRYKRNSDESGRTMDDMKRGATSVCKILFMDFCLRFLVYASSSNSTKFARFSRIKVHIRPHLVRRRRPLLLRAADGHCIFVHYFHLSTLYAHAFRLVTQLSVA